MSDDDELHEETPEDIERERDEYSAALQSIFHGDGVSALDLRIAAGKAVFGASEIAKDGLFYWAEEDKMQARIMALHKVGLL